MPYYTQRLHLASGGLGGPQSVRQLVRPEPAGVTSKRVRAALEEARGVPHPSPTRGHPALRLIEINPAGEMMMSIKKIQIPLQSLSSTLRIYPHIE